MKCTYDGSSLKTENVASISAEQGKVPVVTHRLRSCIMYGCGSIVAVPVLIVLAVWWIFSSDNSVSVGEAVSSVQTADMEPERSAKGAENGRKPGQRNKVNADSVQNYLTPSEAEIGQLYGFVVSSPVVAENIQYKNRIEGMSLVYSSTNDVVNAAARRRISKAEDGKVKISFDMAVYGGAARYARLVGLAAAQEDAGDKGALRRLVEKMPRRLCSCCSEKDALALMADAGIGTALANPAIRQKAVSYSSGMIIGVLAHEVGHHALGHLLAFEEKENLEIARNREREADLFASSVISSSSFGEYVFAGTLFWHYAVAMQTDADSDSGRTHPLSRERFENFVRFNRDKAAAMGIVLEK